MADVTYVTIPEMTAATDSQVTDNALLEMAVVDQNAVSGYSPKKVTRGQFLSDLKEDIAALENAVGDIESIEDNLKQRNLVKGVLVSTIANINGSYVLYPNENERVVYFPVTSGEKYTVYKGYAMSSCRIAYSATVPALNGVVTGYGDFSTSAIYKTFTASATGYACVKITYSGDVTTIANVLSSVCAYAGEYISDVAQKTADLMSIKTINGEEWADIIGSVETIQHVNVIEGYLIAQVTDAAITESTNNTKISVYFPVTVGTRYTLDKKVFTAHTRCGYTANVPKFGDDPDNFSMLDSGNGCSHVTFTAAQNGYCVIWVLDTASNNVTLDFIRQNTIVYKGDYRPNYTKATMTIIDSVENSNHVFYCGSGRKLSTLKAGIEEATKYMDSVLYVDAGTYDLITEFGADYFSGLTSSSQMAGLTLKNRVHVIFSPNSKVVSNYTGNNQYAQSLYSPFNAGEYGFTLENLNLECSRCRYAVHDERNGATEEYKSHYINCSFYIDNSNNDYWHNHHPIGGGLGTNAEVIFENCVLNNDDTSTRWGIYYHTANSASTNKKTKLVVKDTYFVSGTVCLDDAGGNSTVGKSDFIITNCSFPVKYEGTDANGVYRAGLSSSYSNVYAWNNEFRTT